MSESSWRAKAQPIIARVIKENQHLLWDAEKLRKLINKEYPFGVRKYYPHKIWLDEVNTQLGTKKKPAAVVTDGQLSLFG